MNEMYYLFNDEESGEDFFVVAKEKAEALFTAREYFDDPQLVAVMDEEESEWYPYDVY